MARVARPWFRFYVETVGDPKVRRIPFDRRWLWSAVLSAARESPRPGWLYIAENLPMTHQELADYAGAPLKVIAPTVQLMVELGMVQVVDGAIFVVNFQSRQFESDNVTARTRTHRERSKERSTEPHRNVRGNAPETETEAENRSTQLPALGGGPVTRTTPPPEFCDDHPEGTDRPCAACGRARTTRETWDTNRRLEDRTEAEARRRRDTDAAINADLAPPRNKAAFHAARAKVAAALTKPEEAAAS